MSILSVTDARQLIQSNVATVAETEELPLDRAHGRVAATAHDSRVPAPPFANSAMDGIALRASDAERPLPIADQVLAGAPTATLAPGACLRIMTGAPLPAGADTVVPIENVSIEGSVAVVREPVQRGRHIRPAGEDYAQGDRVVDSGTRLGAAQLGALAATGHASVRVYRAPRVALVTTGSELRPPGSKLADGEIFDSNSIALGALLESAGATVSEAVRCADDIDDTQGLLRRLQKTDVDLVVTVGGVSVGEADFIRPALEEHGEVLFWRVWMKPGFPLLFGRIASTPWLCLPGNPVSSLVCLMAFGLPALWKISGENREFPIGYNANLTHSLTKKHTRYEYQRGRLEIKEGAQVVSIAGAQGSGRSRSVAEANCLVCLPAETLNLGAGAPVSVIPFADLVCGVS